MRGGDVRDRDVVLAPAVSSVTPAYCEKPVPSSFDALIWNWLPETANDTGTAPCATPVMRNVEASATGTAASRMRPERERVGFGIFIGSPDAGAPAPLPTRSMSEPPPLLSNSQ